MVTTVQSVYNRYQQPGYVGQLVRANSPSEQVRAQIHIPTNGDKIRPGYGLLYDAGENKFRLPTTAVERLLVVGIVGYNVGTVQSTLSATPSGANSDQYIEFDDDDFIRLGIFGTFWAMAGEALEFGDHVVFDGHGTGATAKEWVKLTIAADANADDVPRNPAIVVSPKPVAANNLVEIRFNGIGR